jgi:hypothetical protein
MLVPITSGFASAAVVSFTAGAVSDFGLSPFPGTANAEVTFTNTGTYTGTGNIQGFSGNWITPTSAAGSAYDIRLTVNSGSTPSGSAPNIWISLGTTRTWTISQSGIGTTASNVTVEIRNASTLAVLSDGGGAFDMTADVST